ncbi:MAG: hypothetical protein H7068_02545 [Pedobacter sp.]|nr:hypothetical protein [Chitinophagaceae bacterium]
MLFLVILISGQLFLKREQFNWLLGWQIILYGLLIFLFNQREKFTVQQVIFIGAIARIVSAFIMPTLSDDVYRFVWDGQLIQSGNNPLLSTPDTFLQQILPVNNAHYGYFLALHKLINHPQYFTCYPPLMQQFFWVSSFVGGFHLAANIIIIKLLVALVDIGCVVVIARLLPYFKLPIGLVILYAFNPSVIVEGSGNAHFEVVQVAFICLSIYLVLTHKFVAAAAVFGLAIITKLIPILLLPLWVRYFGFKKGIIFCIIACLITIASFLPFINAAFLQGFSKSIGLYFQSFEFNASLYYVARKIGFIEKGFNYISVIGPILMVRFLSIYALIFFVWQKISMQQLVTLGMVLFTIFYALSTTVHPWYIVNILPFALLANRLYVVVWAGIAFVSYNAYQYSVFNENIYWLLIEYITVLGFIISNKSIIANNTIFLHKNPMDLKYRN